MVRYYRFSLFPADMEYPSVWNPRGFPAPHLIDGETETKKGSDLSKVPETRSSGWVQRGYFRVVLRPGTLPAGLGGEPWTGSPVASIALCQDLCLSLWHRLLFCCSYIDNITLHLF